MKFSAALDVDLVACEGDDEVTVLLELQAPDAATTDRPASALQIVLDRSGSMGGAPLEGAKRALAGTVARLAPSDVFGVVTFDDSAQVVVPAAPLTDKQAVIDRIMGIRAGGCTDLSSGYLRGLRELKRASVPAGGATMLVVSDGHVNAGIRDAGEFAGIASKAAAERVVTSTLGYGEGYDETLLSILARAGSGNHVFAADPDTAGAAIAGEVDGLLSKAAQAVTLTVTCGPEVSEVSLYNDIPTHQLDDGKLMAELGDLYAAEERRLLLRLRFSDVGTSGPAQIATFELTYVETATLTEHTVTLPISVNVVPGDELSGRIRDPRVQSERLFHDAQAGVLKASQAFEEGDMLTGRRYLAMTSHILDEAVSAAPAAEADRYRSEIDNVKQMFDASMDSSSSRMSKRTRDMYHQKNRKTGRRDRDY